MAMEKRRSSLKLSRRSLRSCTKNEPTSFPSCGLSLPTQQSTSSPLPPTDQPLAANSIDEIDKIFVAAASSEQEEHMRTEYDPTSASKDNNDEGYGITDISESFSWADMHSKSSSFRKQTTLSSFLPIKLPSIEKKTPAHLKSSRISNGYMWKSDCEGAGERKQNATKPCPFYKRIPGTPFSVDAFKYGSIPGCAAYFLSHFHADHYVGLKKTFNHPIYCSQVTGNLLRQQLKVSDVYIHSLPLDKPTIIEGIEVTFLDANHCPGSVLLLFKLKSGRNFLHTGDFRFSPSMLRSPSLAGLAIHQLYLDTTYCSPRYNFPPQDEVVAFAVEKSLNTLHSCRSTLIVCGTYTIGKEKVFMAIAEVLGVKVCVSKEKKAILECLESPAILDSLTSDYNQSCLHVLPMGKLNLKDLTLYLDKWRSKYSQLLAFKPTGWTYSGKTSGLSSIKPQVKDSICIYGIPYSEHSSFNELKACIQGLRPCKIIPTVNNSSAHERDKMQKMFREWLSERHCSSASAGATNKPMVQTKLNHLLSKDKNFQRIKSSN